MTNPVFYDPMIAKMTAHGSNRHEAIQKMLRAIDDFQIEGIANTLSFGKFVMKNKEFINGTFDTQFVPRHFKPEYLTEENEDEMNAAAILVSLLNREKKQIANPGEVQSNSSGWRKRAELR